MEQNQDYRVCAQCVMDTTDSNITFDESGVCNHCDDYWNRKRSMLNHPTERKAALDKLVVKIKNAGANKQYDCIIGVSGGIDSSYVVYLAKELGLRGLLVHLDNGWNSELAVKNIENLVLYSGFDLYTVVIDWEEFKDLQRSFFKSDVIDLELLSDHAIFATVYKLAKQFGTKYLLSGENFETEAVMASSWNWRKSDKINIKAIHKRFGTRRLKTFPFMSTARKLFYNKIGVAISIPILNFVDYDKDTAIEVLENKVGWKYYGGKHFESIFTRFYQGYILPNKFSVDKRRAHLSTLINSGRISREDALRELSEPPYPLHLQEQDRALVCKKLNFSDAEFSEYMSRPEVPHDNYGTDTAIYNALLRLNRFLSK